MTSRKERRTGAVLAPLAALLMAGPSPAFDVFECQLQDPADGTTAIYQGWRLPPEAVIGALRIDDQGAPESGLTPAQVNQAWNEVLDDWNSTTATTFRFPQRVFGPISGDALFASADPELQDRVLMVIEPTTTRAATGESGWAELVGLPDGVLGLCLLKFDPELRRIDDADIILNDDPVGGGPRFSVTGDPFLFDLKTVMAHELGHFAGIAHTQNFALMFPVVFPGFAIPGPLEDDRNAIRFLYPVPGPPPEQPDNNDPRLQTCAQTVQDLAAEAFRASPPGGCSAVPGPGTAPVGWGLLAILCWVAVRPSAGAGGRGILG